ncbi:MAG: SDR family NAD(P)-dependent oxidoreductase [Actinomycetota bacterium]|nr:SDR family NAD(P)-dependent oxidoreductase [Actinomycetota bacterium]MED6328167.1 SDR family NAD(P)-dependent oxidoreductase [Actinomycetota bacterium]
MKDLNGKVAVITGGASGIGLAFAHRFATAGMKVVIGDIEEPALDVAVTGLSGAGAEVLGVRCDVGDANSVRSLASTVEEAFGDTHLLCLNAGVALSGALHEQTLADWEWVLGVNLMGIVHGLDSFLPGLVARDEGHVVITASVAGHTAYPSLGPYSATKHAAVAIAETLYNEMEAVGSKVGATALCPGFVDTGIFDSARNRPERLIEVPVEPPTDEEVATRAAFLEMISNEARQPDEVADMVHDAVLSRSFWVFTDDRHIPNIGARHDEIQTRTNPTEAQTIAQDALE